MITYDYAHYVDLKTKKYTYTPNDALKGPLQNIVRIEGPNNSGKTMLMNIIAWSCYADKNTELSQTVKRSFEKTSRGINSKTSFKITIEDPITKRIIKAEKPDENIDIVTVEEIIDGKSNIISFEEFQKRYNLIYDIPDNPIDRLNDIIREVKGKHQELSQKITNLSTKIGSIVFGISHGRNQALIDDLNAKITAYENQPDNEEIFTLKNQINDLEALKYCLEVKELQREAHSAEENYYFVKKREESKQKGPEQAQSEYDRATKMIRKDSEEIERLITSLSKDIFKTDRKELVDAISILKEYDVEKAIDNGGILREWLNATNQIKSNSEPDVTDNPQNEEELIALNKIMKFLEQFTHKGMILPEIGSIDGFVQKLRDEYDSKIGNGPTSEDFKNISRNSRDLYSKLASINAKITKLAKPDTSDVPLCDQGAIEAARRRHTNASNTLSTKLQNNKYGVTIMNYQTEINRLCEKVGYYTFNRIQELSNKIASLNQKVQQIISAKESAAKEYNLWRSRLATEEKKEVSPYKDHSDAANILKNAIAQLSPKYLKTGKQLDLIVSKSYGSYPKDDPLYLAVWKYIGNKLRTVWFDKLYNVSAVNLIEEKIFTEDGTEIGMDLISTGNNQRNYLLSRLETDDGRPIIALFDEVATMSASKQKDIFDKFEELQKQGRLMVGMMVMPTRDVDDEWKVDQYGL